MQSSKSHNNQKKIAAINDLSGFGRCSMTVILPIISHLKVQCCPVLTAILSNHSAYDDYFFDDYTDKMESYTNQWKKLGLEFEGIYTGFLGSVHQIDIVCRFINDFRTDRTQVIVDPVMGDNGKVYDSCNAQMFQAMKKLVSMADIVTPNLTEICALTDTKYNNGNFSENELLHMARKVSEGGPKKIVITGIIKGQYVANFVYENNDSEKYKLLKSKIIGETRCGTGDIFSSILSADAVNGVPLEKSVKKAAAFVKKCIEKSIEMDIPLTDGVCFEEVLDELLV